MRQFLKEIRYRENELYIATEKGHEGPAIISLLLNNNNLERNKRKKFEYYYDQGLIPRLKKKQLSRYFSLFVW
jgi:hypothetical protein